ncbi:MAG: TIGR00296 family protein [Candidatus Anstonellales archaeon]
MGEGNLSFEEGAYLIQLARRTLEEYFKRGEKLNPDRRDGILGEKRGVFVTLKSYPLKELRGCIGHPFPQMPLCDAVVENTLASAFLDFRFPPLTSLELHKILIEISVLTVPKKVVVEKPSDYPTKIKIGRDGLIAMSRGRFGILLPQVAYEQGWNEEEFLSHCCTKAGIEADSWRKGEVEFYSFSAEIFAEEEPYGKIKKYEVYTSIPFTYHLGLFYEGDLNQNKNNKRGKAHIA